MCVVWGCVYRVYELANVCVCMSVCLSGDDSKSRCVCVCVCVCACVIVYVCAVYMCDWTLLYLTLLGLFSRA